MSRFRKWRSVSAATSIVATATLLLASLAAVSIPLTGTASAVNGPEIGTRLSLLPSCLSLNRTGEMIFPANIDFFVLHGWASDVPWNDPNYLPLDRRGLLYDTTKFELYVDGILSRSNPDNFLRQSDGAYLKGFLTNFRGGMTGTHLFTGQWYLDGSLVAGGTFGASVLTFRCVVRVTFIS